jgi:hypothetical protein
LAQGQRGQRGGGGGRGGFGGAQLVAPGIYRVILTVDGQEFTQTVRVDPDPTLPNHILAAQGEGAIPDEDEEEEVREARTEWWDVRRDR